MHSISLRFLALSAFALQSGLSNAASSGETPPVPCTIHSPSSGAFYDLRSLSLSLPDPDKKASKTARTKSWQAKGYHYNANFSMNLCAPVIEGVQDVVGVDEAQWRNVSAYYTKGGKTYSIGHESSNLTLQGRELVLQYINGSPCGSSNSKRVAPEEPEDAAEKRKSSKNKEDEDKDDAGQRRKSTIISFHCEKEPLAQQAAVSFIATDPDECVYVFKVRSPAACAGAEPVQQTLGPGAVFGIIVLIAVMVYLIGGIMYQRSVAHARGWRQLPNYSLWAGIGSFFYDFFIILTSSCARLLPSRRGYMSVSANGDFPSSSSAGRGRGSNGSARPDDENRLIDQLDEEWDD